MSAQLATYPQAAPPDLASVPSTLAGLTAWAQAARDAAEFVRPLMQTDFIPAHFRPKGNSPEAFQLALASGTAAVLYGADLGISPLQALQNLYVIGGRPAMYAGLMVAIVQGNGHEIWTEELTDSRAVVCGQRRGSVHVERAVFTIARARQAGYTRNKKYTDDPQSMLLARAQADCCRRVARDALLGIGYSAEEMLDEEAAEATGPAAGSKTMKRAPRAAKVETSATDLPRAGRGSEQPPAIGGPPLPGEEDANADALDVITPAQLKKLQTVLTKLEIADREAGLRILSALAERPVESSKTLTTVEAGAVIERLDALADQDEEQRSAAIAFMVAGSAATAVDDDYEDDEYLPLDGAEAEAEGL